MSGDQHETSSDQDDVKNPQGQSYFNPDMSSVIRRYEQNVKNQKQALKKKPLQRNTKTRTRSLSNTIFVR